VSGLLLQFPLRALPPHEFVDFCCSSIPFYPLPHLRLRLFLAGKLWQVQTPALLELAHYSRVRPNPLLPGPSRSPFQCCTLEIDYRPCIWYSGTRSSTCTNKLDHLKVLHLASYEIYSIHQKTFMGFESTTSKTIALDQPKAGELCPSFVIGKVALANPETVFAVRLNHQALLLARKGLVSSPRIPSWVLPTQIRNLLLYSATLSTSQLHLHYESHRRCEAEETSLALTVLRLRRHSILLLYSSWG
jgi:hypothetical protein